MSYKPEPANSGRKIWQQVFFHTYNWWEFTAEPPVWVLIPSTRCKTLQTKLQSRLCHQSAAAGPPQGHKCPFHLQMASERERYEGWRKRKSLMGSPEENTSNMPLLCFISLPAPLRLHVGGLLSLTNAGRGFFHHAENLLAVVKTLQRPVCVGTLRFSISHERTETTTFNNSIKWKIMFTFHEQRWRCVCRRCLLGKEAKIFPSLQQWKHQINPFHPSNFQHEQ